ncbi:hypothetical protein ANANG_G00074320 [Anguilla anguilla]|uniref:Uncharacterized protein n=1 Tax=Anguilla anguilla TaxID=7936 RepID=A0A9D3MJ54_ANGAN|nr:hypothetical protein ANANG_G00074320 [Anguilla anguilla]
MSLLREHVGWGFGNMRLFRELLGWGFGNMRLLRELLGWGFGNVSLLRELPGWGFGNVRLWRDSLDNLGAVAPGFGFAFGQSKPGGLRGNGRRIRRREAFGHIFHCWGRGCGVRNLNCNTRRLEL